jgi:hypothetical protein
MPIGELVFANLVDQRLYRAQGREAEPGIYVLSLPGRSLPFVAYRAWKVPTGFVSEEILLTAPSGRVAYRWGPALRRMRGSMDLTIEDDVLDDAVLVETGSYLASFALEGEIVGEIEVPVFLQSAPGALPKHVEDGLKRSDIIWVGVEQDGQGRRRRRKIPPQRQSIVPAWFAYRNGRIYLLSQREPGPAEQTIPGLPDAPELVVVTRRKGRDTSLDRFHATVRILEEGPEYEQALAALADRRRSRVGPPGDSMERWRRTCIVAELTPTLSA